MTGWSMKKTEDSLPWLQNDDQRIN